MSMADWLKERKKKLILSVVYYSGLIALSSIPSDGLPAVNVAHIDKIAHLSIYGGLGFLLARVFPRWWMAVAVGSILGGSDELYQLTTPGRHCSWWDWTADVAGVCLGCLCLLLWRKRKNL